MRMCNPPPTRIVLATRVTRPALTRFGRQPYQVCMLSRPTVPLSTSQSCTFSAPTRLAHTEMRPCAHVRALTRCLCLCVVPPRCICRREQRRAPPRLGAMRRRCVPFRQKGVAAARRPSRTQTRIMLLATNPLQQRSALRARNVRFATLPCWRVGTITMPINSWRVGTITMTINSWRVGTITITINSPPWAPTSPGC
jgi:hypothetical protein